MADSAPHAENVGLEAFRVGAENRVFEGPYRHRTVNCTVGFPLNATKISLCVCVNKYNTLGLEKRKSLQETCSSNSRVKTLVLYCT